METKPGYLTTEFWGHAILQILMTLNNFGVWTFCPPKYVAPAQLFTAGIYALGRGWAKSQQPYLKEEARTRAALASRPIPGKNP